MGYRVLDFRPMRLSFTVGGLNFVSKSGHRAQNTVMYLTTASVCVADFGDQGTDDVRTAVTQLMYLDHVPMQIADMFSACSIIIIKLSKSSSARRGTPSYCGWKRRTLARIQADAGTYCVLVFFLRIRNSNIVV
jgi:hypothetical protein